MIFLEEAGLEWKHVDVNIRTGDQFTPEFLKLNPNNKIPAMLDTDGPGGAPYSMMESGAILIYLAEKSGKFLSKEPRKRYDTLQWLIFQMASVGPMFGQAGHFINVAKEGNDYARNRYLNEALRLYKVLDNRLADHPWLAGDEYSIADMAVYPWTKTHKERGVTRDGHPAFVRWYEAMEARPAVQRNNALADEIRARMTRAAEGKEAVNIYDTRDNAARLAQATARG
jgi:GST-like protein